jgi:hypothetical protein
MGRPRVPILSRAEYLLPRGRLREEVVPTATCAQHVEDTVEGLAVIGSWASSALAGQRQQLLQASPFLVA